MGETGKQVIKNTITCLVCQLYDDSWSNPINIAVPHLSSSGPMHNIRKPRQPHKLNFFDQRLLEPLVEFDHPHDGSVHIHIVFGPIHSLKLN